MTLEFDNDEITNEQLEDAANFFDELDTVETELDWYDAEAQQADEDWNEQHEAMDMGLLDAQGEIHDYDYDNE
jgi:hypothetical protein